MPPVRSVVLAFLLLASLPAPGLPVLGHHNLRDDHRIVEPYGVRVQAHIPVAAGYEPVPTPEHCYEGDLVRGAMYAEDFDSNHGYTFTGTDLASSPPGQASPNLWHATTFAGEGADDGHSAGPRLYFGKDSIGQYGDTFSTPHFAGSAVSPPITLPATPTVLSFATKWEVEWLKGYDHLWVELLDAAGEVHVLCTANAYDRADPAGLAGSSVIGSCSPFHFTPCPDALDPLWESRSIQLPPTLAGQTVRIQFTFDAADSQANEFMGWMVDDVKIGFGL
jgi:hypothetical protein